MEEGRSVFKPTGKRPFGSPRSKWEDNIRMDRKEIGINTRNWIDSAQDMEGGIEPPFCLSCGVSFIYISQV